MLNNNGIHEINKKKINSEYVNIWEYVQKFYIKFFSLAFYLLLNYKRKFDLNIILIFSIFKVVTFQEKTTVIRM